MDEAERLADRVAIVDHGKVIALGTPQQLIASLGAEHVVAFSLAHEATVSLETLRAVDGVIAARVDAGTYELQVTAVHHALPALLGTLERSGLALAALSTHSPTLEDVFVSLTGRALREG